MKQLTVFGLDNFIVGQFLLDIEGENFALQFPMPMFMPVIAVTLTNLDPIREKKLRDTMSRAQELLK